MFRVLNVMFPLRWYPTEQLAAVGDDDRLSDLSCLGPSSLSSITRSGSWAGALFEKIRLKAGDDAWQWYDGCHLGARELVKLRRDREL